VIGVLAVNCMPRTTASEMGFPPFRGAVRDIIVASVGSYVAILLLMTFSPRLGNLVVTVGALDPTLVRQGWIWQLVTYAFIYVDPLGFVFSLLFTYLIGAAVEAAIGRRQFYYLFFGSAALCAMAGVLLSLTGMIAQGNTMGCGPTANAIFIVLFLFNPDTVMSLLFTPFRIPIRLMVLFVAIVESAYALLHHFALADVILLLGLGVGYVWHVVFFTGRTTRASVSISEKYFSLRNTYYRWKRRRAARKFEVYMRDQNRTVTFDEHGNFVPPEEPDKKNGGGKSGWVN